MQCVPLRQGALLGSATRSHSSLDAAIDACARAVSWQKALHLGAERQAANLPPNVAVYTTVLNACGKGRQWHLAAARSSVATGEVVKHWFTSSGPELFRQMPSLRIAPTVVTYNAMINACVLAKRWEEAICWFVALAEGSLASPSVISYNSLIHGLTTARRWPEALLAWQRMQREGIQPTAVTINSLSNGLPGRGSLHLLSLCAAASVQPDLVLCNTVLDNCQKLLLWQRAMHLLQEMPSKLSISPDEVSYNSVINALELSHSWQRAVHLLQTMVQSSLKPSIITYNCTMAATEKSGLWERTLQLWDALHTAPTEVTGDVVLSAEEGAYAGNGTALSSGTKWAAALEFATTRRAGPAGLAAAWSSCEEQHQLAAVRRLRQVLPQKVQISRVWQHSSLSVLMQGTALWWLFLSKLFASRHRSSAELEDAVLPSAAARLWPFAGPLCCGAAWREMAGALSLPTAPSVGFLPVAVDVCLDGPAAGSLMWGPEVIWASVSSQVRRRHGI